MGVTDIQDKINGNGGRAEGMRDQFHFRDGKLLA